MTIRKPHSDDLLPLVATNDPAVAKNAGAHVIRLGAAASAAPATDGSSEATPKQG